MKNKPFNTQGIGSFVLIILLIIIFLINGCGGSSSTTNVTSNITQPAQNTNIIVETPESTETSSPTVTHGATDLSIASSDQHTISTDNVFEINSSSDIFTVSAKGTGSLDRVRVCIKSESPESIVVRIPAGTIFVPENREIQKMVIVMTSNVTIAANDSIDESFPALCIEMNNEIPGSDVNLFLYPINSMGDLSVLLDSTEFQASTTRVKQFAVWTITDNPSRRDQYMGVGSNFSFYGSGPSDEDFDEIEMIFQNLGIWWKYSVFEGGGDNYISNFSEMIVERYDNSAQVSEERLYIAINELVSLGPGIIDFVTGRTAVFNLINLLGATNESGSVKTAVLDSLINITQQDFGRDIVQWRLWFSLLIFDNYHKYWRNSSNAIKALEDGGPDIMALNRGDEAIFQLILIIEEDAKFTMHNIDIPRAVHAAEAITGQDFGYDADSWRSWYDTQANFDPPGSYTNPIYGYSLILPDGWERIGYSCFYNSVGLFGDVIVIDLDSEIQSGTDMERSVTQKKLKSFMAGVADYNILSQGEIVLTDNTPGYEILLSYIYEDTVNKSRFISVFRGKQMFCINVQGEVSAYDDLQEEIDQLILSFTLTGP